MLAALGDTSWVLLAGTATARQGRPYIAGVQWRASGACDGTGATTRGLAGTSSTGRRGAARQQLRRSAARRSTAPSGFSQASWMRTAQPHALLENVLVIPRRRRLAVLFCWIGSCG